MPDIAPLEWGPGLIVRHAVSQGYVVHVAQIQQATPVFSGQWTDVQAMGLTVSVDEPSTVLQLFRCTAHLTAFNVGRQMYFRLRHGSQYGVRQTHEAELGSGWTETDRGSITLFRTWPVSPGDRTFGVQVMWTGWDGPQWPAMLYDARMTLAVLKR